MADIDHLILGSGINALVAAAMLPCKGDKVLAIERENQLGDCMLTSDEMKLPFYHDDVMAATFVLFLTGPTHGALGEFLATDGLELCYPAHLTMADGLDDVALMHLADGSDSVSNSSNAVERSMLPAKPAICVGQPYAMDPTRCPEGKPVLWRQISGRPVVIKGDAANNATSIKGLYLIGASGHSWLGLGDGSGFELAKGLGA